MKSASGKPWRDPGTLEQLYHEEELSLREVADRLGCDRKTVWSWMDKFGIERRSQRDATRVGRASFWTDSRGYETWSVYDGEKRQKVRVHTLLAIAAGNDPSDVFSGEIQVHHKKPIPWYNTVDNVEVLSTSEHRAIHNETVGAPWKDEEVLRKAYSKNDSTELAERWGCHPSTILYWLKKFGIKRRGRGGSK